MLPSVQEMEAYIRQAALARGIDPDTAVRVARSEGLSPGTWQANAQLSYGREQSYGPFQLHVAPKGHRGGMGNDFIAKTGLNPADPANWRPGVDFALDNAKRGGWGPWFGAKKIGVTGKMGIGGVPVQNQPPAPPPKGAAPGASYVGGLGMPPPAASGSPQTAFPGESPNPPSFLGNALAGLAGLSGGPSQHQPSQEMSGPPVDFTQLLAAFGEPGRALVQDQRKKFAMPEVGSLADLLGTAAVQQ